MPWSARFEDPIPLPAGKPLITLKDAADYIERMAKADQDAPHWQTAIETLINAAEIGGGWLYLARIAMLQALHHGRPKPEPASRKKHAKRFKIITSK